MIADPRSRALSFNFAGQWLRLRNLPAQVPNERLFPNFGESLRQDFRTETELFFDSLLRDNRSVLELLTADYTFLNERLARHYQVAGVHGTRFRRVTVADDARRGLLGHGSILTTTSYPDRTSPVVRGKWILENLLGTAPPPPPPDVNTDLKPTDPLGKVLSMRERMAQHRANAVCAGCHALMDPLGLSLENFDAIGRWRTVDESQTSIDASAILLDGTKFEGPAGLRRMLLERSDQIRDERHGEAVDVCPGARRRALRPRRLSARSCARRLRAATVSRRSWWPSRTASRSRCEARSHAVLHGGGAWAARGDCAGWDRCSQEPARRSVMFLTKMALPRRTFLRGMGATVALPLLDAMVPALSADREGCRAATARWASSMFPTARPCRSGSRREMVLTWSCHPRWNRSRPSRRTSWFPPG